MYDYEEELLSCEMEKWNVFNTECIHSKKAHALYALLYTLWSTSKMRNIWVWPMLRIPGSLFNVFRQRNKRCTIAMCRFRIPVMHDSAIWTVKSMHETPLGLGLQQMLYDGRERSLILFQHNRNFQLSVVKLVKLLSYLAWMIAPFRVGPMSTLPKLTIN